MNNGKTKETSQNGLDVLGLTKAGIVAALYVVISLFLAPFSFGAVQIRVAEMFNFLALYNKRYLYAVTLGVIVVNLFSPLGMIDVVVGTLSTFIILHIIRFATRRIENSTLKLVISTILITLSMFTIALENVYVFEIPFWPTYISIAAGELASLIFGAVIFSVLEKRIDLTK